MTLDKLDDIKDQISLISYEQNDLVFYAKHHQSSALIMKNLIEITSLLEMYNINYTIDDQYNIYIVIDED